MPNLATDLTLRRRFLDAIAAINFDARHPERFGTLDPANQLAWVRGADEVLGYLEHTLGPVYVGDAPAAAVRPTDVDALELLAESSTRIAEALEGHLHRMSAALEAQLAQVGEHLAAVEPEQPRLDDDAGDGGWQRIIDGPQGPRS